MLTAIVAALLGSAGPEHASDELVNEAIYEKASAFMQDEQFERAAALFSELHDRTGDRWALYNEAQALRLAGDCDAAIPTYFEFLEEPELDERDRFQAARNIERCGGDPERPPEEQPQPPPPIVERPKPTPTSATTRTADRPDRVADRATWAMLGGGVGALAVGAPLLAVGLRDAEQTPRGESESDYVRRVRRGRAEIAIGSTFVAVGSTLIITSTARALWRRRHRR